MTEPKKTDFRPRWWTEATPEEREQLAQDPGTLAGSPPLPLSLADQARDLIAQAATLPVRDIRRTLTDLSLAFEDLPETEQDETTRHLIYRPFLFLCEYDRRHRSEAELRSLIAAVA